MGITWKCVSTHFPTVGRGLVHPALVVMRGLRGRYVGMRFHLVPPLIGRGASRRPPHCLLLISPYPSYLCLGSVAWFPLALWAVCLCLSLAPCICSCRVGVRNVAGEASQQKVLTPDTPGLDFEQTTGVKP